MGASRNREGAPLAHAPWRPMALEGRARPEEQRRGGGSQPGPRSSLCECPAALAASVEKSAPELSAAGGGGSSQSPSSWHIHGGAGGLTPLGSTPGERAREAPRQQRPLSRGSPLLPCPRLPRGSPSGQGRRGARKAGRPGAPSEASCSETLLRRPPGSCQSPSCPGWRPPRLSARLARLLRPVGFGAGGIFRYRMLRRGPREP